MMTLEQYYLVKLAEEAAELAQMALKCAHFGITEVQPSTFKDNGIRLQEEYNDVLALASKVNDIVERNWGVRYLNQDFTLVEKKWDKVDQYLKYSQRLNLVEKE